MKIGKSAPVRMLAFLGVFALGLVGLAIWVGNRNVETVSAAEATASFKRAVAWVQANESYVRRGGNAALW